MNESKMLDENETLGLLRAGHTGIEPTMPDVTAHAIRAGSRMRLRRRAVRGTSGLALAGLATVAIVAGAPGLNFQGRTVVQPAGRADDPSVATTGVTGAEAKVKNRQILARALGPDFRVRLSGDRPQVAAIELVPASPTAEQLPDGYTVRPAVYVTRDGSTYVDNPCNPDDPAKSKAGCERRTLANGVQVLIFSQATNQQAYSYAATDVYAIRPGADLVLTSLAIEPAAKEPAPGVVPRAALLKLLGSFEDGLVAAAADPGMSRGTAPRAAQTSDARYQDGRNRDYLGEALGDGWVPDKGGLAAQGAARAGLPADYLGRASLRVGTDGGPIDEQCPATPRGGFTCERRTLTDGRRVVVQVTPVQYFKPVPGGLYTAYSGVSVMYVQPDTGDAVMAEVRAMGVDVTAAEPAKVREQVMAWLAGVEDMLTRAATDPRMAVDSENH